MLGFSPISATPLSALPTALTTSITADASITQSGNTLTADASVSVTANYSITSSGDTTSSNSGVLVTANANITQADNSISATGLVTTPSFADANITQSDTTLLSDIGILITPTGAIYQSGDTVIGYIVPGLSKHSTLVMLNPIDSNSSLVPHTQKASITMH